MCVFVRACVRVCIHACVRSRVCVACFAFMFKAFVGKKRTKKEKRLNNPSPKTVDRPGALIGPNLTGRSRPRPSDVRAVVSAWALASRESRVALTGCRRCHPKPRTLSQFAIVSQCDKLHYHTRLNYPPPRRGRLTACQPPLSLSYGRSLLAELAQKCHGDSPLPGGGPGTFRNRQ